MRTLRTLLISVLLYPACVDGGAGETGSSGGSTTGGSGETPTSGSGGSTAGSSGETPTGSGPGESSSGPGTTGDTGWTPASCYDGWADIKDLYADAGTLQDCADVPGGYAVVRSLLVVDGITIDNDGVEMQPCVEARCDAEYAYIASNNLPHYDYVQTTPNALVEAPSMYRIALAPTRPGAEVSADPVSVQSSCVDAYNQHLDAPNQATATEPSSLCNAAMGGALSYLRETLESGETATYTKILCLGSTGVTINGVGVNGPNEAGMPDPFGNPLFAMPDLAGEPYLPADLGQGAALDLCGGHSGGSMHYHGFNAACFAQAPDGTPAQSYAEASQAWDVPKMLDRGVRRAVGGARVEPRRLPDQGALRVHGARRRHLHGGQARALGVGVRRPRQRGATIRTRARRSGGSRARRAATTRPAARAGRKTATFRCAPVVVDG
jgi:hypothetical protein